MGVKLPLLTQRVRREWREAIENIAALCAVFFRYSRKTSRGLISPNNPPRRGLASNVENILCPLEPPLDTNVEWGDSAITVSIY